jgi:hypothetical protein
MEGGRERCRSCWASFSGWSRGAAPSPATVGRGSPSSGAGHRFAAQGGMELCGRSRAGSINGATTPPGGVMTPTSTRPAAPEPFTSPALAPTPGSAPGHRAGRSRPGCAACGRRRRDQPLVPRRSAMRWNQAACLLAPGSRWVASTAAQRTSLGPCLVIGPRRTLVSDSRWRGVSPAQEHNGGAPANRCTSPISATNTAANTGLTRGWSGGPGSRRRRPEPWRAPAKHGDLLVVGGDEAA